MKNNTPQEKAIELVNKFKNASFNCTDCDMPYCDVHCTKLNTNEAKECALIAVDEIGKAIDFDWMEVQNLEAQHRFWDNVKQEIEKL
jgi:uncharacterized protein YuzE